MDDETSYFEQVSHFYFFINIPLTGAKVGFDGGFEYLIFPSLPIYDYE